MLRFCERPTPIRLEDDLETSHQGIGVLVQTGDAYAELDGVVIPGMFIIELHAHPGVEVPVEPCGQLRGTATVFGWIGKLADAGREDPVVETQA